MFLTLKTRLLLGLYVFLIISVPVGAYLASQYQTYKSSASEGKAVVKNTPLPSSTPNSQTGVQELLSLSESNLQLEPTPTPSADTSPTIATSFGPTLSLKINIDGRPKGDQSTKLFVGIMEGDVTSNPKFLLSFSINVGKDGSYSNLSLAGLTAGSRYVVILKGAAQIASSASFSMSPTVTNLNDSQAIDMLTGDLNEDNVINAEDYSLLQKALGSSSSSGNWNDNFDFNKDGFVNLFDLAILNNNLGKIGVSGAWTSPLPKVSSASASLISEPAPAIGGYWMWIPK